MRVQYILLSNSFLRLLRDVSFSEAIFFLKMLETGTVFDDLEDVLGRLVKVQLELWVLGPDEVEQFG